MMDGVVRVPSEFSITLVELPSMMATHELVVPRSMPMILPMLFSCEECLDAVQLRAARATSRGGCPEIAVELIYLGAATVTRAGRSTRSAIRERFCRTDTTV